MGKNQRLMLPRLSGGAAFAVRRGSFLDGKVKTWFGPGQGPENIFTAYQPPTDWNAAYSLLRVPQVVWLQTWFDLARPGISASFKQVWQNFYPDKRFSNVIAFFDNSTVPPTPYYYGDGPYTTFTTNTDLTEHDRIVDVFGEVKARIEAVRPGRTWVQVVDWDDPEATFSNGYFSDGFLQIVAPPGDPGTFFGTDFMHVWVGHGAYSHFSTTPSYWDFYTPESPPEDDPLIGSPIARLEAAYDAFRGHTTLLYHPNQPWNAPDVTPNPEGRAPDYYPYEITKPQTQAGQSDFFDFLAGQYPQFSLAHAGGSTAVTADALVGAIAARFGFDPNTGKPV